MVRIEVSAKAFDNVKRWRCSIVRVQSRHSEPGQHARNAIERERSQYVQHGQRVRWRAYNRQRILTTRQATRQRLLSQIFGIEALQVVRDATNGISGRHLLQDAIHELCRVTTWCHVWLDCFGFRKFLHVERSLDNIRSRISKLTGLLGEIEARELRCD